VIPVPLHTGTTQFAGDTTVALTGVQAVFVGVTVITTLVPAGIFITLLPETIPTDEVTTPFAEAVKLTE
jgi:hypothetical protein